jgi:Glycosyl hydrolase family 79 C-terminal beta domain
MRWGSRSGTGILLVPLAIVIAVATGLIDARGSSARVRWHGRHASPAALSLTVDATTIGRPIPAGFLGFSFEYPTVEKYAGFDPEAINPVLVQLIRNLTPGQRPVLRIGGDTTDWTWWPVPGVGKPGGIRFSLDPRFARVTAELARDLDARLILGINLEADSATVAATEARELVGQIGRSWIEALELGNEPELYGSFSWYTTRSGIHVPGRSKGYDFATYQGDYARISAALPDVPLAGPASGTSNWIAHVGAFLPAEPQVRVATVHRYPLQRCYLPAASAMYPSISHLLSPAASQGLADSVAPEVTAAHARRVALRVDEINSVSCGGALGVSNVFASALWALDATFEMARVGVDGVNFHTFPGARYELFNFWRRHGRWRGFVAPEYYGLETFAQAAPSGSSLLHLSGALGNVKAWATRAPGGAIHVVLINEYTRQSRTVSVRIAAARGTATLERLSATRGIAARTGVTLGGQHFAAATTTGTLQGRSTVATLTRTDGAYLVRLPAASAALLTLTPRPSA